MAEFYEFAYRAIESGKFPRGLPADTDPDHYFQVQCYHAYNFGGDPKILRDGAEMIVRVMQRHGDGGKKIFITEFGYHDSDFVKTRGMTKEDVVAILMEKARDVIEGIVEEDILVEGDGAYEY